MTLYKTSSLNIFKTWLLMSLFLVLIIAFGFVMSAYYGNINIIYGAIIFSLALNFFSYFFSDKIALSINGANEIKSRSIHTELWNVVENLSITAGLPMPRLYIIDDPIPNAFATGRNENNSAVAVTNGLLLILNKSELEGVIAHELSHIKNKDILIQTIVVVLVGAIAMISELFLRFNIFNNDGQKKNPILFIFVLVAMILVPIAASIIRLAISRKREFLADSSGALLTRYPEGLANALQKISQYNQPLKHAHAATAHMYIVNPLGLAGDKNDKDEKVSWFSKLFMTHPDVSERVRALLGETMAEKK